MTAGLAVTAAACSPEKPGAVAKDGSVTVKHAFGETKIPSPPKRVVSAGYNEQDDLLAVGVVPVAVTNWFGDQPFGVWPWAQPKLGTAQPVVLDLSNGIQIDQIATLKPDLIVATNAGLDADTYAKLSAIAPTVAQSGEDAFFEPWKDQANIIGQAVFKDADMGKLISDLDDKFVNAGKSNTSFSGKKVFMVRGAIIGDVAEITPSGWRTDFLTKMGFVIGGGLDSYVKGDHALVPRDKMASVLDGADVADLDHGERPGPGRAAGRPDVRSVEGDTEQPKRPHRNGSGRRDHVRHRAVLWHGGRPTAGTDRQGARLRR